MKIPMQTIIDMGMLRKQNKCTNCKRKMDLEYYNVQLCRKCRIIVQDDFYSKMQELEYREGRIKTNFVGSRRIRR
jgi:Zn finger protein HypA/HybF involved in hydrogenase expression